MDLGISGRVAIVTGASAGIGFAVAEELLVNGAFVLIAARDASRLQKAETELRTRPAAKVASIAVDVVAPETGSRIVDAAVAAFGALETLVNIFGIAALQSRRLAVNFTAITAIRQRHGDWANNMVPALRRTHRSSPRCPKRR